DFFAGNLCGNTQPPADRLKELCYSQTSIQSEQEITGVSEYILLILAPEKTIMSVGGINNDWLIV
ncbi:MAG: hypothetical protein KAJ55_14160, partial [Anaerolineales bacterium]|nr:hypothetical protein [Anaerolineales bacterium]